MCENMTPKWKDPAGVAGGVFLCHNDGMLLDLIPLENFIQLAINSVREGSLPLEDCAMALQEAFRSNGGSCVVNFVEWNTETDRFTAHISDFDSIGVEQGDVENFCDALSRHLHNVIDFEPIYPMS